MSSSRWCDTRFSGRAGPLETLSVMAEEFVRRMCFWRIVFMLVCIFKCHLLFSHSTVSNSLWSHELQHTRLPCPSLSPEVCSAHVHWISDAIQPSYPLSPRSSFALKLSQHLGLPVSWLFASGVQSTGAFASASVLPMNIQGWFPLELTGFISLLNWCSKTRISTYCSVAKLCPTLLRLHGL